jgi:hypothetical protein
MSLDSNPGDGAAGTAADANANAGAGATAADSWVNFASDKPLAENEPSPREWVQRKGYADLDSVIQRAREADVLMHSRAAIPKEGDPPEKFTEFWSQLGRPESAEGYKINAPEGAPQNEAFTKGFQDMAFAANMPAAMAEATVRWWNDQIMTMINDNAMADAAERDALKTEWGQAYTTNMELARRGQEAMGIDDARKAKLEAAFGHKDAHSMLKNLGSRVAEDVFVNGARQPMGLSPQSAQAKMDAARADKSWTARYRNGDPAALAEFTQWTNAIAWGLDQKGPG